MKVDPARRMIADISLVVWHYINRKLGIPAACKLSHTSLSSRYITANNGKICIRLSNHESKGEADYPPLDAEVIIESDSIYEEKLAETMAHVTRLLGDGQTAVAA